MLNLLFSYGVLSDQWKSKDILFTLKLCWWALLYCVAIPLFFSVPLLQLVGTLAVSMFHCNQLNQSRLFLYNPINNMFPLPEERSLDHWMRTCLVIKRILPKLLLCFVFNYNLWENSSLSSTLSVLGVLNLFNCRFSWDTSYFLIMVTNDLIWFFHILSDHLYLLSFIVCLSLYSFVKDFLVSFSLYNLLISSPFSDTCSMILFLQYAV